MGKRAFFQPKIEMIQAAGLHLHHHFISSGLGFGQIAKFKFPRRAVGDELDRFHALTFKVSKEANQPAISREQFTLPCVCKPGPHPDQCSISRPPIRDRASGSSGRATGSPRVRAIGALQFHATGVVANLPDKLSFLFGEF